MRFASTAVTAALLGLLPSAYACPPSLDIGTYAIDYYTANGGGAANLTFQEALAGYFASNAANVLGGYPGCPIASTHPMNLSNAQVTKAAVVTTGNTSGQREYNDFVFYGGHGVKASAGVSPSLFLGSSTPTYGNVYPINMPMGGIGKYNRWFMAHACVLFPRSPLPSPAASWSYTFRGLKAMLGFESFIYDNSDGNALFNQFWTEWTYNNRSLWDAFADAEAAHGYSVALGGTGIAPGCLSAYGTDYCAQNFASVANDYNPAQNGSGSYHSQAFGSPNYP